jgi:two-component system, LuxR family, sensor kinase FixL
MATPPAPPRSRIIFDSTIGIGFGRQISDIPANNGMKENKKQPAARRRTRAGSAVRDQEQRLRAILDTAVEGIITIDERGVIESFNPASEKIFGYRAAEVIGKNVRVLMATPHREQHDGYLENYKRTGHAKIIGIGRETFARKKDGTLFPIDLSVSEVKLSDRRIFTGFIRDITERKRLEKENLEISEREQRRIGRDLHDGLCQHLAGIEMLSQVLARKLAPRAKEAAARATDIARAVRDAISQTRLLARGLSPVTLESEGLMSALAELALNTEKMFRVRCEFDCPEVVKFNDHAAATHLFRIAQEAVSNAIRHGKAIRLLIQLRESADGIALRISDDGVGFPDDFAGGSGMGLRVMQTRIGMVGGTLRVEQPPDGGVAVICHAPHRTGGPHGR